MSQFYRVIISFMKTVLNRGLLKKIIVLYAENKSINKLYEHSHTEFQSLISCSFKYSFFK